MTTVYQYNHDQFYTVEDALRVWRNLKADLELGLDPTFMINPRGLLYYIDVRDVEGVLCLRMNCVIDGEDTFIRIKSNGDIFVNGELYGGDK